MQVLLEVETGEGADDALARLAPKDPSDRALAWRIVWGVLRHRRELDEILEVLTNRPPHTLDPVPLQVLRTGLYELRYSRVPAHAAVNEAVDICKALGAARASGLVNAVLRRQDQAPPPSDRACLNHPEWLLRRWEARLGPEVAARWASRNNLPAPLGIVAREDPVRLHADFVAGGFTLIEARAAGEIVPGVFLLPEGHGPIQDLPGFAEGRWWVQDPAAVVVADMAFTGPGTRILDACAAPGGKCFRLVSRGAQVVAADRNAERLRPVGEGARRLGFTVPTFVRDWARDERAGDPALEADFDAVLVDAPCSGLGTLRRHPEIRWRRAPTDLARNAAAQLRILKGAACHVRPGGLLVYAVCSTEPEEGSEVIRGFLAENPGFILGRVWMGQPALVDEDAFWAAQLVREG